VRMGGIALWLLGGIDAPGTAEKGKVRLISREIIFEEFQPMNTIPQRYRLTDRRTNGQLALAIPRSAPLRAEKMCRRMACHL